MNETVPLLMVAAYILLIFFALDTFREGWAIAPLAASTFIAFTFSQPFLQAALSYGRLPSGVGDRQSVFATKFPIAAAVGAEIASVVLCGRNAGYQDADGLL